MYIPQSVRRHPLLIVLVVALCAAIIAAAPAALFPEVIPLPNGFQPEGIASGEGTTFFVGSIPTGAVYRGDLASGQGAVLVPAQAGRNSIGMKYDARTGLLFVAGGPTGKAFIYDGGSGATIAEVQLTAPPSFINDVVITQRAAYFTDSFKQSLYKIPLGDDGELPGPPVTSETIPLGGEYDFRPGSFNANGIDALPNGKTLVIVNSTTGTLYQVDPTTGSATRIDLGGGTVPAGDGILLQGKTLYVVQNNLNQVAVIDLSSDYSSGEIVSLIKSPLFRVPTTIAGFGDTLYVVNARFGTPPGPDVDYDVVRVPEE
jgi:sugar lactone lactonase YvrE